MRLAEATVPVFARHETFHPRYGWFRKAYASVIEAPDALSRRDAPVAVGVGKNMVRSIRFWGMAAKLITEHPERRSSPDLVPTRIGHALFGKAGWDPFMEDPGTLWLLHWLLMAPPSRLPVWWIAFNQFTAAEFDDVALDSAVAERLEAVPFWKMPHPKSRKKDVRALVRTYGPPVAGGRNTSMEDALDCPLRELRLIGISEATGRYRFADGGSTLPPQILLYALLDYVARAGVGGNTITLGRLASEPGAPGRVFRTSEAEITRALEVAIDRAPHVRLVRTAGAQLSWLQDPARVAVDVLSDYYHADPSDMRAGHAGDLPVRLAPTLAGG